MKQRREIILLAVLVLVGIGIWWSYFRGDKPVVTADVNILTQSFQKIVVDNPEIRTGEIERTRKAEYKSNGRNIFHADLTPLIPGPAGSAARGHGAAPPVFVPKTPCGVEKGPCPEPPKPPPPPPTLPVKFFGFGSSQGGPIRRAFFTNGEDVYIVDEGQLLLNRFRILKVGNASLEFEEVSTGRRGSAPLEEQPGAASPQSSSGSTPFPGSSGPVG